MTRYYLVSISHTGAPLSEIGRFVIREQDKPSVLKQIKHDLGIDELMYVSTCNRVFFLVYGAKQVNTAFVKKLFSYCKAEHDTKDIDISMFRSYYGKEAVQHLFRVTSSLESMVLGESEIITQVRTGFEFCEKEGVAGDAIRLVMNKAIETAKLIFTQTGIARGNASVASVAAAEMIQKQPDKNAAILFVGAGATNMAIAKILYKAGYQNFIIFNRTQGNGEMFAAMFGCQAFSLDKLPSYNGGFDVLIACTHSPNVLVTKSLFEDIVSYKAGEKILIDLAVPEDIDPSIAKLDNVTLLNMSALQEIVSCQLNMRKSQVEAAELILSKQLKVFVAFFRKWVFSRFMKVTTIGSENTDAVRIARVNELQELFKKVNPDKHNNICSLLASMDHVKNNQLSELPR